MNIAIFSDTFYPKIDGIVTTLLNQVEYLKKQRHNLAIFCPKYNFGEEKDFGKNVQVHRFPCISLPSYKEVKLVAISSKKVQDILKEFKADLIHINTPGFVSDAGVKAAKRIGIPIIGTYHTLVSEQMSYMSPASLLGINWLKNKITGKDLSTLKFLKKEDDKSLLKRIGWSISLGLYNKCDIIASPSVAITNLLKKKKVKGKAIALSNGIDLRKFSPKKKYSTKDELNILHVGRISFEKSVDIVVKAVILAREKSGKNITLKIVGGGPALESTKKLVNSLGAQEFIKVLGKVDHDVLTKSYQNCDLFVTASAMETQGLVILEAMATGTPCIGVKKFAVPDLIKDGYNGFLADPYDEVSFSKAILKILNKKKELSKFGKNALATASQHELKKCMKRIEDIYKGMIKK